MKTFLTVLSLIVVLAGLLIMIIPSLLVLISPAWEMAASMRMLTGVIVIITGIAILVVKDVMNDYAWRQRYRHRSFF